MSTDGETPLGRRHWGDARYGQWTLGFADPPLSLEAWNRKFEVSALNCRGRPFLPTIFGMLKATSAVAEVKQLGIDLNPPFLFAGSQLHKA